MPLGIDAPQNYCNLLKHMYMQLFTSKNTPKNGSTPPKKMPWSFPTLHLIRYNAVSAAVEKKVLNYSACYSQATKQLI